ncbi:MULTISPECIES: hypothetical protein [unclassified Thioalkalivibrio]|uniref:hypothetical protein n=1 Tax=unclassified Thioalkalivibrio TaxID=2621013 RepID=UPI000370A362|nr:MULTISPECIES: hypothetical protein [unclassified Thioalkalivibrio]
MEVLAVILTLVVLSLVGFRVHTHLAIHERRVVSAWNRLDTLLTQRNGLLHMMGLADPDPLVDVQTALRAQEAARRRGDLPALARTERSIRATWDTYLSKLSDENEFPSAVAERTPERVAALDQAITDALARYNAAVADFSALRRHWALGPLARLAGYQTFDPIGPPPDTSA